MLGELFLHMLTIRIIRAGREGYYLTPESDDLPYLLGSGADLLGLGASSLHWTDDRLKLLLQGIHPTTHHYLRSRSPSIRRGVDQKTGKEKLYKPVVGYDLVANAPKDVSILALVMNQPRAVDLHEVAVERTLTELDPYCLASGTKSPLFPIVLVQSHIANRSLEPHLHSHCLILNTGLLSPDSGRSLDGRTLFKASLPLGELYRKALRSLIESELGLHTFSIPLRKGGEAFGIRGIPEELRALLSTRSDGIRSYVKETKKKTGKAPSGAAIRVMALKTRQPKQQRHEMNRELVERSWREQVGELTLEQLQQQQEPERAIAWGMARG